MSAHTHTPTPWSRAYNYGSLEIEAPSPDEPGKVFTVAAMISERDFPVLLAAPDLLNACKFALLAVNAKDRDEVLRAAIAKATP